MRKKLAVLFLGAALTVSMLGACGGKDAASSSASAVSASSAADASSASVQDASKAESSTSTSDVSAESASAAETAGESSASELEDGTYTADFNTDSNMFHVNEAKEGKGVLTVKDGKMTIHVSLVSQNIVNVFVGTKEEAQADGAELIEPTTDEVTYSDGTTDEVYGFDIPVEKLDEDFNVAIIGKKGTWYDHVVSVSNPVPQEYSRKKTKDIHRRRTILHRLSTEIVEREGKSGSPLWISFLIFPETVCGTENG